MIGAADPAAGSSRPAIRRRIPTARAGADRGGLDGIAWPAPGRGSRGSGGSAEAGVAAGCALGLSIITATRMRPGKLPTPARPAELPYSYQDQRANSNALLLAQEFGGSRYRRQDSSAS